MSMLLIAHAMSSEFKTSTEKLLAIYLCDQIGESDQIMKAACILDETKAAGFCCVSETEVVRAWESLKDSGFFDSVSAVMDEYTDSTVSGYKKKPIPKSIRNQVYERDGYVCVQCESGENLTLDHHYPERFGGKATVDNLKTMCASCNSRKGSAIPADKRGF